jgi:hypothetical protein
MIAETRTTYASGEIRPCEPQQCEDSEAQIDVGLSTKVVEDKADAGNEQGEPTMSKRATAVFVKNLFLDTFRHGGTFRKAMLEVEDLLCTKSWLIHVFVTI